MAPWLEADGDRWSEPIVLVAEGAVAAGRGDADEGRARLEEAAATATAQGSHALARRAAALAADLGLEAPARPGDPAAGSGLGTGAVPPPAPYAPRR